MYRVETVGEDVDTSIQALPSDLLSAFAELRVALEVAPWNIGRPYVVSNPDGSRTASFGPEDRGMVLYAVEELQQLVLIWQVTVYPDLGCLLHRAPLRGSYRCRGRRRGSVCLAGLPNRRQDAAAGSIGQAPPDGRDERNYPGIGTGREAPRAGLSDIASSVVVRDPHRRPRARSPTPSKLSRRTRTPMRRPMSSFPTSVQRGRGSSMTSPASSCPPRSGPSARGTRRSSLVTRRRARSRQVGGPAVRALVTSSISTHRLLPISRTWTRQRARSSPL